MESRINYVARYSVIGLAMLPSGVFSAWGGKSVYRRMWKAYIVERSESRPIGTFFKVKGVDWLCIGEELFQNKKALSSWAKRIGAVNVEAA